MGKLPPRCFANSEEIVERLVVRPLAAILLQPRQIGVEQVSHGRVCRLGSPRPAMISWYWIKASALSLPQIDLGFTDLNVPSLREFTEKRFRLSHVESPILEH